MTPNSERILGLLQKQTDRAATAAEQQELMQWLADHEDDGSFKTHVFNMLEGFPAEQKIENIDWETIYSRVLELRDSNAGATSVPAGMASTAARMPSLPGGRHFLNTTWVRYAAAVILLATSIVIYLGLFHTSQPGTKVVQHTPPSVPARDVLPGSDRAVLTLSDGSKIELNSVATETINDGNLSIENSQGNLSYKNADAVVMNTMTIPKGGQYKLTLADGTSVWLNAASSITYPTAFKGKTREVTITGEAYFEVARNAKQPFVVKTPSDEIRVLGTSFNVNAYPDEPSMKTSLLEGSVRVGGKVLKPGQAFMNGKIVPTNVEQDVAWKNGLFNFNEIPFHQAMRQLARWYDVEIAYNNGVPGVQLKGKMDRNLTLNDALAGLDGMGARFTLQGRIVHVDAFEK